MPQEPDFPPLLTGHRVDASRDPFRIAADRAASGAAAAGDLFWRDSEHRLAAAIVLEPEEGTAHVEAAHLATMVALGDCIGALSPPEVGVFYRWPDKICINGAVAGVARLIAPDAGGASPAWLVTGVDLRIHEEEEHAALDPGRTPEATTLWEEGCGELRLVPLLESFARHLKAWLHTLETEGPRPIHEGWLARAEGRGETITVACDGMHRTGRFLGLGESGDLVLKTDAGTELLSLKAALS